jgi:hypothetical protein
LKADPIRDESPNAVRAQYVVREMAAPRLQKGRFKKPIALPCGAA